MSPRISVYFERIGKALFTKIKIPIFLALVSMPLVLCSLILLKQKTDLQNTQARFCSAMKKAKSALQKKNRKEQFLARYSPSDPYFLDTHIESLNFLEDEKKDLKLWLAHQAIADKRDLQERLNFLNSEENALAFIEDQLDFSNAYKETVEKQRYPVQIDHRDLKRLLTLIEDIPLSGALSKAQRPQLLITDFVLKKLQTPLQNEVFEVEMQLLKREFL